MFAALIKFLLSTAGRYAILALLAGGIVTLLRPLGVPQPEVFPAAAPATGAAVALRPKGHP